jgi:Xaa-Pro aminopeptidase
MQSHLDRLTRLRAKMDEDQLDGWVITGKENRRYLSGFTGSNGALLIGRDKALLLSDFRYKTQIAQEAPEFELVLQKETLWDSIGETMRELGWKRVGIEADHLSLAEYQKLEWAAAGITLIVQPDIVAELRQYKDASEIDMIRDAVLLADRAWKALLTTVRPGEKEREVALRLETTMRQYGAEGVAFETIVASGPRGALPHGLAGERTLADGDLVVIDFGCILKGYHSDMTRTILIGHGDERQREVYQCVLQAQETALRGLRPGITGREGDRLARQVIEDAGYGQYFGHGLGHSLGLAIHENPRLSPLDDTILQPGMVLTVEPGIYLPEWGGVRIEDVVVMTETGCEILTTSEKALTIID